MRYVLSGLILWISFFAVFFLVRPKVWIHTSTLENPGKREKRFIGIALFAVIVCVTLPMAANGIWNGQYPGHRNQYELLTDSFADGHLYLEYNDWDPDFLDLENPYNCYAEMVYMNPSLWFRYDHAFYNGHYYVYFGVVPVLLFFLPLKLLTGLTFRTFIATQVFTAVYVAGVFCLFYAMARRFFRGISCGAYVFMASAGSVLSVWVAVEAPAMYCTAIMAALCLEIWSIYLFFRAVWIEPNENNSVCTAFWGALLGALAFGCRPPVALANILVLPMLFQFLRQRKVTRGTIAKLIFAASPYLVVAAMIMVYNYVRFDNILEFGQRYQLTNTDQSGYDGLLGHLTLGSAAEGVKEMFFAFTPWTSEFPYLTLNGAFFNFPLLLTGFAGLCSGKVRQSLKRNHLTGVMAALVILAVVIAVFDTAWTPMLIERYHLDIYWILAIFNFIVIGFWYQSAADHHKRWLSYVITLGGYLTVVTSIWLFIVPNDYNLTEYYPECLELIKKIVLFWKG